MSSKGHVPPTFKDMLGLRFTRLAVVARAGSDSNGNAKWHCQCDCGNTTISSGFTLRNGQAKSCGCLTTEQLRARAPTHRMSNTATYHVWQHMFNRCYNPNNVRFHRYGGRGIKVCERWFSFENFYADMGERPSKAHSIDRADNDLGYSPDNCRWATRKTQDNNSSRTHYVVYHGEKVSLTVALEMAGNVIGQGGVRWRLKRGWTLEAALETPSANYGDSRRSTQPR